MSHNKPPARSAARLARSTLLAILISVVVLACVLGFYSIAGPSSEARSPGALPSIEGHNVPAVGGQGQDQGPRGNGSGEPPGRLQSRVLGSADGEVTDGTTAHAGVPAVTNLDPVLLTALREAATAAAADRVELDVNSGWRSYKYQQQLFVAAVARYGSEAEAERWVARPGTSVHEAGDAVDIGPTSAATWLARNGATFGLCQIYGNEPWHFELRSDAITQGCPASYTDAAHDPRMQQ